MRGEEVERLRRRVEREFVVLKAFVALPALAPLPRFWVFLQAVEVSGKIWKDEFETRAMLVCTHIGSLGNVLGEESNSDLGVGHQFGAVKGVAEQALSRRSRGRHVKNWSVSSCCELQRLLEFVPPLDCASYQTKLRHGLLWILRPLALDTSCFVALGERHAFVSVAAIAGNVTLSDHLVSRTPSKAEHTLPGYLAYECVTALRPDL